MKMWNAAEEAKYKVQGIMLNLDNTAHGVVESTTDEDVIAWANQFKGTHITDMIMNIAESASVFPSRFGWYGDKYHQKVENGHPVDYSKGLAKNLYVHYIENKRDYLKVLEKALPAAGINMWLSIRMNDAHDRHLETSVLFTDFYHNHPEYRRIQYKTKCEGYAKLYDYGHEEIRNKYLDLIDESLERYDVFGFQLEWQRNPWIWKVGHEYAGIEIMNQFMRDAKAIITKYEKKYGHKIMFSVQVVPDIQTNYDYGFDIARWAAEGLIDMVVPKGRHGTTCNEIPIGQWKSTLECHGVQVVPDIEHRIKQSPSAASHCLHDIETYAGTAALYYSQGADKVQVYNLLVPIRHIFKDEDKIAEYDPMIPMPEWPVGGSTSVPGWWLVFTTLGSYDKLMTMNRKVIPTYNETVPSWRERKVFLPRTIQTDDSVFIIRVGMGDIPKDARATFKIASDVVDATNPPVVFISSYEAKLIGTEDAPEAPENHCQPGARRTANRMYCYEIPEEVRDTMFIVAEIQSPNIPGSDEIKVKMTIDYAEVYIEPAK